MSKNARGRGLDKETQELRKEGRVWRIRVGLSQEEVSTLLGLTKAVYGLFERGKNGMSKRNKEGLRRLISIDKTGLTATTKTGEKLRKITCGVCYQETVYSLGDMVAKFCLHCGKQLK